VKQFSLASLSVDVVAATGMNEPALVPALTTDQNLTELKDLASADTSPSMQATALVVGTKNTALLPVFAVSNPK
jgi:hypothetical protein